MKKTISIFMLTVSLILASCSKERISQLNNLPSAPDVSPAVNNEESWNGWISRQWNDNSAKWIGGTVCVAVAATGLYFAYVKLFKNNNVGQPPQNNQQENLQNNQQENLQNNQQENLQNNQQENLQNNQQENLQNNQQENQQESGS